MNSSFIGFNSTRITLITILAGALLTGCTAETHLFNYNGYQNLKFANGTRYEGQMVNNKFSGHGIYTWKDGDRFDGTWLDDKPIQGVFTRTDGTRYEGGWTKYNRNGQGVVTTPSGETYSSEWIDGKATGFGTSKTKTGNKYAYYHAGRLFDEIPFGPEAMKSAIQCKNIPQGWWMRQGHCGPNGPEGEKVVLDQIDGMSEFSGPFKNGKPAGQMTQVMFVQGENGIVPEASIGTASGPNTFSYGTKSHVIIKDNKADWENFYAGEIRGAVLSGKGRCHYNGALEACEYQNGRRVDKNYIVHQENKRIADEKFEAESAASHAKFEEAEREDREDVRRKLDAMPGTSYDYDSTKSDSDRNINKIHEDLVRDLNRNAARSGHAARVSEPPAPRYTPQPTQTTEQRRQPAQIADNRDAEREQVRARDQERKKAEADAAKQAEKIAEKRAADTYLKSVAAGTKLVATKCPDGAGKYYAVGNRPNIKPEVVPCVDLHFRASCSGSGQYSSGIAHNFIGSTGCFGDTAEMSPTPSCKASDVRIEVLEARSCGQ